MTKQHPTARTNVLNLEQLALERLSLRPCQVCEAAFSPADNRQRKCAQHQYAAGNRQLYQKHCRDCDARFATLNRVRQYCNEHSSSYQATHNGVRLQEVRED